ncbi:hypothetical protein BKA83DRAFT_4496056 [Pisolithus microcarpus]|nr:hypothetical protein BKA83DRAFT_4496056 [Pisolithus microcarpus]
MPNGTLHGNNTFTPGTANFSTDSAHHVTNCSPTPNGETPLECPDPSRYSLDISEWHKTLPTDNPPQPPSASGDTISDMPSSLVFPPPPSSSTPPSVGMPNVQFSKVHPPAVTVPPSSTGKQSHTKMIGNNDGMSAFPSTNASDISTPTHSKCLQLLEAMNCARSSSSHHTHKATPVSDPMAAGLQGSINYLTSSMHSSMSLPLATRTQVLQLLSKEGQDLPSISKTIFLAQRPQRHSDVTASYSATVSQCHSAQSGRPIHPDY